VHYCVLTSAKSDDRKGYLYNICLYPTIVQLDHQNIRRMLNWYEEHTKLQLIMRSGFYSTMQKMHTVE